MTDTISSTNAVLTVEQMYAADQAAVDAGVPSIALMEAAGTHLARVIKTRFGRGRVAVLCGPGNKGGDGFVAARLLRLAGWTVRLGLLGQRSALTGDAAANADRWVQSGGKVEPLSPVLVRWADIVVDALFGAGLSRALDGVALEVVTAANTADIARVSVDVPSGVSGDTGAIVGENGGPGVAIEADVTVTFFRRKPGHVVLPGRDLCGDIEVCDIGIPESVLAGIRPMIEVNRPPNAGGTWPLVQPSSGDHKYARGHAVVFGSEHLSGAARLAAAAARRVGAGLVTVAAPLSARSLYLADAPGLMFHATDGSEVSEALADARRNAVAIGPGYGVGASTKEVVLDVLKTGRATVLDADVLSSFEDQPETLFAAVKGCSGGVVMTPHEGEFARLFRGLSDASRVSKALEAAAQSGSVIVLKGSDTVIASPEGLASVSDNAPPGLATAGSGDVLTGLITGLLAQGLSPWDAARAAVWIHGAAAGDGIGLIAEDLVSATSNVLRELGAA